MKDHTTSSSKKSSFLGTLYDDMSLILETGPFPHHGQKSDQDQARKSSSDVDPRLLMLLEFFRQLYVRKRDMFKKMFPESHDDEFVDQMLKKIGAMLSTAKSEKREDKTLQRSLSVGSPRPRSIDGDEPPLRLERFKVRTLVPGGGGGDSSSGGQGDTKSGGTKSK
ncbi:uncharacterized protein LOC8277621 [Ricinus communis]|uniref:Uncharacterized protein n=1 Tax=Ricinus communis TaxID=3988 RepID=B9T5Z1_RICCO|nr:uncharacterized protein LOC8277621 [Ricinus communis]EEF28719.1 conserved hypothetical protein [Ricinus communis]|eukprot:XP_002533660.1 uncharacterized protein LOC8277621 [Ricinus communis]